jgi:hypothetical protein
MNETCAAAGSAATHVKVTTRMKLPIVRLIYRSPRLDGDSLTKILPVEPS